MYKGIIFKHLKQIIYVLLIIHQNVALSLEPCQDFCSYACSNKSLDITNQLNNGFNEKLLQFFRAETAMDRIIKETMSSLTKCSKEQTFFDKIMIYFEACITETKSIITYLDDIKEVFGNMDYWSLLGKIQSYGLENIIVKHNVQIYANNSVNIMLAPVATEDFKDLSTENLELVLENLEFHNKVNVIETFRNMELQLKNLSNIYDKPCFMKTAVNISFKDLKTHYPRLKLQEFLNNLLGHKINDNTIINIKNTRYFQYLNDKQWTKEEQKNLCWYLLLNFINYLWHDQSQFDDEACIQDLRNKFDLAINFIYYYRYFRWEEEEFSKAFKDLHKKLKVKMLKIFEENHLDLCGKEREYLMEKLHKMKINFGHLIPFYDLSIVQDFYADLPDFNKTNYYENHLKVLRHQFYHSLRDDHQYHLSKDNTPTPFYESDLNTIVIPFPSLQLPLYHYRQTHLQQFSLLGYILGHEMTHAFDNIVLPLDNNEFAWSITNNTKFKTGLQCMMQQHNTPHINERLADFVGLRLAYHTYEEHFGKNSNNNWKKGFFMNFAMFFCNAHDIYTKHDEDSVRLQQILRNFSPFAEVFKCKMGDVMHPKDKCRIY